MTEILKPREFERRTGVPVLDPEDPVGMARAAYVMRFYRPELQRQSGHFFYGNHFGTIGRWEVSDEEIRGELWQFLGGALKCTSDGRLVPLKPNRAQVDDVFECLCGRVTLSPWFLEHGRPSIGVIEDGGAA